MCAFWHFCGWLCTWVLFIINILFLFFNFFKVFFVNFWSLRTNLKLFKSRSRLSNGFLIYYFVWCWNSYQNLAIGRELPDIPGNDILVLVPGLEGLQPPTGLGGLGLQQPLLCLVTRIQGVNPINLSHGYFTIRAWSSKPTYLVRSISWHHFIFTELASREIGCTISNVCLFVFLRVFVTCDKWQVTCDTWHITC